MISVLISVLFFLLTFVVFFHSSCIQIIIICFVIKLTQQFISIENCAALFFFLSFMVNYELIFGWFICNCQWLPIDFLTIFSHPIFIKKTSAHLISIEIINGNKTTVFIQIHMFICIFGDPKRLFFVILLKFIAKISILAYYRKFWPEWNWYDLIYNCATECYHFSIAMLRCFTKNSFFTTITSISARLNFLMIFFRFDFYFLHYF